MSLKDEIEAAEADKEQLALLEKNLRLNARLDDKSREVTAAKTLIRSLQAEIDRLEVIHDFLHTPLDRQPGWLTPKKKKHSTEIGRVFITLSDLHLDEVVRPEELQGRNAYNREIAEMRLKKTFEGVIEQATYYHTGTQYDGCVALLGGDLVSGFIHDELRETNEFPLPETVRHWVPLLAEGLIQMADQFGRVHVSSVVGNHGRLTTKPRYKLRAFDNADWLISALLAERFASDPRFSFDVPEGTDAYINAYDKYTFLLTHGDQASGGGGIGGIWPPIMKLRSRKQANNVFDWMVIGHWHQYVHSQGITVNGSLKGYDEFAAGNNFQIEEPKQAMWIVTPEHGVTWPVEIYCADRKAEGW